MSERRIRSIPPNTALRSSLQRHSVGSGGLHRSSSGQGRTADYNIQDHIYQRQTEEKPKRPSIIVADKEIAWDVEICEEYNIEKHLGVVIQFSGIVFPRTPIFQRSRTDYGLNNKVFYSQVHHECKPGFLILVTYGDIVEAQVVAAKIDQRPFFQKEILVPQLTVTHDPTSMRVINASHGLVILDYARLDAI